MLVEDIMSQNITVNNTNRVLFNLKATIQIIKSALRNMNKKMISRRNKLNIEILSFRSELL